eukprot:3940743-Rhodomonas_salina.4
MSPRLPCRPPTTPPIAPTAPATPPPPSPLPARPDTRWPQHSSPAPHSPARSQSTRTSQRSPGPGQRCMRAGVELPPPLACTPF